MTNIYAVLFLVGFALIAIPNVFMRLKSAPGIGAGGFRWPWQTRDRYTPTGFRLFVAGWVFWLAGAVSSISILTSAIDVHEQRPEPVPAHDSFTLESRATSDMRQINVYLPPDYGQKPDARYPVLYMPDGGIGEDFPHIATTIDTAIRSGEMQSIVLVGVENTERRRDMTGPTEVAEDRKIAPHVGGSAAFREFFAAELMPEISRRYRVTDETGIIGESAAGLFIVETFFLQPDLFDKYIALSPSLWWNNEELVRKAAARLRSTPDLDCDLYLSAANEADIAPQTARLAAVLEQEAPPGLRWQFEPRPDLRHHNIYRTVSPAALRLLYPLSEAGQ